MAERYQKFSFTGYLDQAVCDLIEDGIEHRREHGVSISSAPDGTQTDLYEVEKFLDVWSGESESALQGLELPEEDGRSSR